MIDKNYFHFFPQLPLYPLSFPSLPSLFSLIFSCFCFSFLFCCRLHFQSGNLFFLFLQISSSVCSNKFFLILVVSIQFSPFISLASFKKLSSVALPFPEFLPPSFSPSHFFFFSLFSYSLYPNYTIAMISSIFLDISLFFSCCYFSFLFSFSFPIQQSLLLLFFSLLLCSFFFTFLLISVVSISTHVFLIH